MASVPGKRTRRDLTAGERRRLATIRRKLEAADRLLGERDQLILEIYATGADVDQIAEILQVSRETIYMVIRKAR